MLRNQTTKRQKEIIHLISRIQVRYTDLGNYKSHTEDNIGVHVVLTNGKIFVPHIAVADPEFAFQKPDMIGYIKDSFNPLKPAYYDASKQPLWKKLFNLIKLNDKSSGKYVFE
ncbi:MAG: hypothetical protein NVV82_14280 [Sporocytophaga sp.]|nr:hypothetical protein [Sporocytophaga sp.]